MAVEISLFMYQSSNLHGRGERKMDEIGNRLMNENMASFHVQSVGQEEQNFCCYFLLSSFITFSTLQSPLWTV